MHKHCRQKRKSVYKKQRPNLKWLKANLSLFELGLLKRVNLISRLNKRTDRCGL